MSKGNTLFTLHFRQCYIFAYVAYMKLLNRNKQADTITLKRKYYTLFSNITTVMEILFLKCVVGRHIMHL